MMNDQLFKWTNEDGRSANGGSGLWSLPTDKKPGAWRTVKGDLVPCENGLHLCRRQDLLDWCAPALFLAEHSGKLVESDNKVVVRKARLVKCVTTWNERSARLFACDCADRVLHIYEKKYPDDSRVRNAIEVARKVANGDLPVSELAAAWATGDATWAAWAAARAAWAAARAAARAARATGDATGDATWAARAAAWATGDATGDAARAAARAAERDWQTNRLMEILELEATQ